MEKQTLENILAKFEEIQERDDRINKASEDYWKAVAPSNYTPFTEYDELSGFLDGIKLLDNGLYDEICNWLYEGYSLPSVWEIEGQEFNISGYGDFKKYLMWRFCKS